MYILTIFGKNNLIGEGEKIITSCTNNANGNNEERNACNSKMAHMIGFKFEQQSLYLIKKSNTTINLPFVIFPKYGHTFT